MLEVIRIVVIIGIVIIRIEGAIRMKIVRMSDCLFKKIFFVLSVSFVFLTGCGQNTNNINVETGDINVDTGDIKTGYEDSDKPSEEVKDFSDCFDNLNGCAAIYSPDKNKYTYYNKEMCKKEVSPFSTFKIVGTLMGLNNGILESEDSKMGYDGTDYSEQWNKDLTLKEAFKVSCVWYFRKVINAVGQDEVSKELNKLNYGNKDCSEWKGSYHNETPDLSGFWLDSSLKISPKEQVEVIYNIFSGKTDYSENHIAILKDIMKEDTNEDTKLYGKTGTGREGIGWYAGYFEKENENHYFSVYIHDKKRKNISGYDAKNAIEKIINKYY